MKKIFYVILFVFVLQVTLFSEEKKKQDPPPIELPDMTITGKEKEITTQFGDKSLSSSDEKSDVLKILPFGHFEKETMFNLNAYKQDFLKFDLEDKKKNLFNLFFEAGNYNYYSVDFVHGGQSINNNYLLNFLYLHDGGERENTSLTNNKIIVDITQELESKNFINVYTKFMYYDMDLPGGLSTSIIDKSRRTENINVLATWEKRYAHENFLKLTLIYDAQNLKENNDAKLNENKTIGLKFNYAFVFENPVKLYAEVLKNEYLDTQDAIISNIGIDLDIEKLIEDLQIKTKILYSNYQDIDSQISPSLELLYTVSNSLLLDMKILNNFSIPSFDDFYLDTNFTKLNIARLLPEKSWDYKFGFRSKYSNVLNFDCYLYQKNILNQVVMDDSDKDGLWMPKNRTENTYINGSELNLAWMITNNFKTLLDYNYKVNKTKDTQKNIPFVPNHELKLTFNYLNSIANLEVSGKYKSERLYDITIDNDKLKSYVCWGAKIYKDWNDKISGFIAGENLNSYKYEEIKDYPFKKIRAKFGVKIKF